MAIDNREKRQSCAAIGTVMPPSVTPNSGKDQEWRQQAGWGYSGILATGAAAVDVRRHIIQAYMRANT